MKFYSWWLHFAYWWRILMILIDWLMINTNPPRYFDGVTQVIVLLKSQNFHGVRVRVRVTSMSYSFRRWMRFWLRRMKVREGFFYEKVGEGRFLRGDCRNCVGKTDYILHLTMYRNLQSNYRVWDTVHWHMLLCQEKRIYMRFKSVISYKMAR